MADDPRLTDAQARRLWQRAAELQAEAARSLEEASKGLVRRDDTGDEDDGGYSLDHVRQAAVEAGISPEFVDRAIEESGGADVAEEASGLSKRVLGDVKPALMARRVFDEPAPVIFASLQRVLPRLRMSLVDTRGGDPLEGGWMFFDLPSVGLQASDRIMIDLYHWADVRSLHVRLVPLGDDRCEVTLRAPLDHSRKLSTGVVTALSPVGGMILALITGAILSGVVGGAALTPAMELLALWGPVAGMFGLGTAGGGKVLRSLVRNGWARGEAALERLLASIAMDARTGGAFQPALQPPSSGITIPGLTDG